MNSAPARNAARAVSGSSTVPAPSRIRLPSLSATFSITRAARGTVNVTSITSTPPASESLGHIDQEVGAFGPDDGDNFAVENARADWLAKER